MYSRFGSFAGIIAPTSSSSTTTLSFSSSTTTTKRQKNKHILVIVESPSKCKTLQTLLTKIYDATNSTQFTVLSSYGHVRDLTRQKFPTKTFPYAIAGINLDSQTYTPQYDLLPRRKETVQQLLQAAQKADMVWIATDPDREGEGIAWHLLQVLSSKQPVPYRRIRLTEITETAVRNAIPTLDENDPTSSSSSSSSLYDISQSLVTAQETRRILDRLAGFTVSPILWKKLGIPGLSAGRVQSVGLARIVQREIEIMQFQSTNYYTLRASLLTTTTNNPTTATIEAKIYSINGQIVANTGADFTSRGHQLVESSKHKLHIQSLEAAQEWIHKFTNTTTDTHTITWKVTSIETKPRSTAPPNPYKTSTLQIDASRKLGWSVAVTMKVAQQLYESGCISYMRTDNVQLSFEAELAATRAVRARFGDEHIATIETNASKQNQTSKTKKKKNNSKFAQEAHEAIRPAINENGTFPTPEEIQSTNPNLSSAVLLLYRMIYQRTLAYVMKPRIMNHTSITIEANRIKNSYGDSDAMDDGENDILQFRATASVVVSPGYSLAYSDDDTETTNNESSLQKLPFNLVKGQTLDLRELIPLNHTTQPTPRFTEASLVKELESLGVGRPSTYASVIQLLRDRAYVMSKLPNDDSTQRTQRPTMSVSGGSISAMRAAGGEAVYSGGGGNKAGPLIPSLTAFVVCKLLQNHCPTYVDPLFTASMEERLDRIARGDESMSSEEQRVAYLNEFYAGENGLAAQIKRIDESLDSNEARRANLPSLRDDNTTEVGLFVGPWGPYVQKLSYDDDNIVSSVNGDSKPNTAQLPPGMAADISSIKPSALKALLSTKQEGGDVLGTHPNDGRSIRLKTGRFGAYLQWGDDGVEGTTTHSLPRNKAIMRRVDGETPSHEKQSLASLLGISLEEAIGYVSLPRTVGTLEGLPITCAIGPYGPYLKYNNTYTSLKENDGNVLSIDKETAARIVTERINEKTKSGLGRGVLANLGEKEGEPLTVKSGRFGKYLNWKKVNAKLPSEHAEKPEEMPLEEAWKLIQARAEKTNAPERKRKESLPSKKVKLPAPPKRPLSAYMHYCAAMRPILAAKSTKPLTVAQLSKQLSVLWAELNPEERKAYEDMAARSRETYEKQRSDHEEECLKLQVNTVQKKASRKDDTKPKRSKSAYLYFCAAKRPEVAKTVKSLGDISKELARLWAETKDRTEYEEMAAADKRRYEEECEALKKTSSTKTKQDSEASLSTRRAPSAYMLFCREMWPQLVDENGESLPFVEATKRLATLWKECSEDTRDRFKKLAEEEKMKLLSPVA